MTDNIYSNDYLRRLLIEAPYIRARLTNQGGSVILTGVAADTERVHSDYSTQIGSSFHLDLIEAESALSELPTDQQDALRAWAEGVSAKEAALYSAVKGQVLRKRRERGISALSEKLNDKTGETHEYRGNGDPNLNGFGSSSAQVAEATRHHRRTT